MTLGFLALLLLTAAEAGAPVSSWCLVYPGRVEAVHGPLPLDDLELSELREAWHWSETSAPRRLEPDELADFDPPRDPDHLVLRIAGEEESMEESDVSAEGRETRNELRVVAAPIEMWSVIPESLLPTWEVPAHGRLEVPRPEGTEWRARLVGRSPVEGPQLRLSSPTTVELVRSLDPGRPGDVCDLGVLEAEQGVRVEGRLLSALDLSPVTGGRIWALRQSPTTHPVKSWYDGAVLEATSDESPPASAVARVDLGNRWMEMDMVKAPFVDGVASFENLPPGTSP